MQQFGWFWEASDEATLDIARPILLERLERHTLDLGWTPDMTTAKVFEYPAGWDYRDPLGGRSFGAKVNAEWGVWEWRTEPWILAAVMETLY